MFIERDDFTAKLMNDMDPELLDFLKTKANSFIKWDLVRFFHENPNTIDTAENIARYIGRNAAEVKQELEGLVESGVMSVRFARKIPNYSLTGDEAMRELIERFISAYDDRHFRVKAVYHIIRQMR